MMLVVEHGAVELERRIRTKRQIGAVGHHQPRGAVEAGANDFVAKQSVADIDPAGRRSLNAEHFILDDGRFADARLGRERTCRQHCDCTKHKNKKRVVTRFHFKADRLSRYRTGSRTQMMW